jgi:hypothetical protein
VESALEHDDGGLLDAARMPVQPRQLDGGLVGFRAGIAKKAILHLRNLRQCRAELFLRCDAIEIRSVDQLVGLRANGRRNRWMRMAQSVDCDAGDAVQIAASVSVKEVHSLAVTECHW